MKSDSLFNSKRNSSFITFDFAGGAIYELPYLRYFIAMRFKPHWS